MKFWVLMNSWNCMDLIVHHNIGPWTRMEAFMYVCLKPDALYYITIPVLLAFVSSSGSNIVPLW